jgi:hypothetical protein
MEKSGLIGDKQQTSEAAFIFTNELLRALMLVQKTGSGYGILQDVLSYTKRRLEDHSRDGHGVALLHRSLMADDTFSD